MKKPTTISSAALLLALSLPAFAGSCPRDMQRIDAALAAGPSIGAAELERVRELRASGEQLHKAGKHAESVADLRAAKKLLAIE